MATFSRGPGRALYRAGREISAAGQGARGLVSLPAAVAVRCCCSLCCASSVRVVFRGDLATGALAYRYCILVVTQAESGQTHTLECPSDADSAVV